MQDGPETELRRAEPFVGRLVGNYVVERKLGAGGMGAVYLLRHSRLPNTFAALKVLAPEARGSQRMQERFQQEALAAAAVGSHRVVRPLDVGAFEDGTPYIVMEFVAGRSLADVLTSGGPMPVLTALKIAWRVADTMVLAHEAGIIHRDLKPQNIMLGNEGGKDLVVKVLDFGVARATGTLKVAHTGDTELIGTPGYMSPEAVAAMPVDGRTDVFSLGVILHALLTGELPFPAPSVQAAIMNVLTLPAPAVSARRPAHLDRVPEDVERLLARALAKEPSERPTMAALHQALGESIAHLSNTPSGEIATMMSIALPAAALGLGEAPTLSTPAGRVAALIGGAASQPAPSATAPRSKMPKVKMAVIGVVIVGASAALSYWLAGHRDSTGAAVMPAVIAPAPQPTVEERRPTAPTATPPPAPSHDTPALHPIVAPPVAEEPAKKHNKDASRSHSRSPKRVDAEVAPGLKGME